MLQRVLTIKEIAWLAGWLEGEGCFRLSRNCPIIAVHVTDKDVAYYAAKLLMAPNVHSYKRDKHKRIYGFALCSTEAASWMMTLYPLMGKRRKAKIKANLKPLEKA